MDQATFEKVVLLVFEKNLLNEEGMMIIEHSKYTKMEHLDNFSFQKSYGGSFFSFFEFNNTDDEEELDDDDFEVTDSEEE